MYAQSLGRWLMRIELDKLIEHVAWTKAEHGEDSLSAQLAVKTLNWRLRTKEESKHILHETKNLYLNSRFEICLNGDTHAVVVGKVKSKNLDAAKRTMERLEQYPDNLRRMFQ